MYGKVLQRQEDILKAVELTLLSHSINSELRIGKWWYSLPTLF